MRLSDAILKGTKKRGGWYYGPDNGVGACAMEAAMDAVGLRLLGWTYAWVKWPWAHFGEQTRVCPSNDIWTKRKCTYRFSSVAGLVYHLNDLHRWPHERIAYYVRQFEPMPLRERAISYTKGVWNEAVRGNATGCDVWTTVEVRTNTQ